MKSEKCTVSYKNIKNSETKMFKGKIWFSILKLTFQTTKKRYCISNVGCSKFNYSTI